MCVALLQWGMCGSTIVFGKYKMGGIKWDAMSLVISFINILGRMCDGFIMIYIKWFTYRELCIINQPYVRGI